MQTVVGVRFKSAGKIYTFGQGRLSLTEGDYVIVETTRGMECGKVVVAPHDVPDEAVPPHLRVVHRRADLTSLLPAMPRPRVLALMEEAGTLLRRFGANVNPALQAEAFFLRARQAAQD